MTTRLNNNIEDWNQYLKANGTNAELVKREVNKAEKKKHEDAFSSLWKQYYPDLKLTTQCKIIPRRKFRFDFVHKESKVSIEINGKIWQKGGHSSGTGLLRDYTKSNLAAVYGWVTFTLAPEMITMNWLALIAETIQERS